MGDLLDAIRDLDRRQAEAAEEEATLGSWALTALMMLTVVRTVGATSLPGGPPAEVREAIDRVLERLDEAFAPTASGAPGLGFRWAEEWEAWVDWNGERGILGPWKGSAGLPGDLGRDPQLAGVLAAVATREMQALVDVFDRRLRSRILEDSRTIEFLLVAAVVHATRAGMWRAAARAGAKEGA
ncbi:MAG: hypothetical protein K6U87_14360 [Firmicutes bacterium]|nr:hypothetical protein [Bacillota bacterium]